MIAFALSIHHFKQFHLDLPFPRIIAFFGALACALGGLAFILSELEPAAEEKSLLSAARLNSVAFDPGDQQPRTRSSLLALTDLAGHYADCIRTSRPVLLGSRKTGGKTCFPAVKTGDVVDNPPNLSMDFDGGAGTSLALLLAYERLQSSRPTEDFNYHQQRLKPHLRNQLVANERPLAATAQFADRAQAFAELIGASTTWPAELLPVAGAGGEDWLGYCLNELNQAAAAKDLKRAQRWARELATAAFSLHDLHRWLEFLCDNYLTALDFQQQCESVFAAAESQSTGYEPLKGLSYLPAGLVTLHGNANFLEIERRSERMFTMPTDRLAALSSDDNRTSTSIWMSPAYRAAFLRMENVLSPKNRQVLALAARTPYEHSYLTTMLNRAQQSDTLEPLIDAVRRFDASHPQATVEQLMDVLMYRGHSYAGLEWGDRYQAPLAKEAASIQGSDLDAFYAACRRTNDFYRHCEYHTTLTLRQSLELNRLDCVRSTDMIAAIFRNAGRTSIGHVRASCGTFGHSVAAYLGHESGRPKVLLGDGLDPSDKPELWPEAYFHGHRWPAGLENSPTPYTVELYVRGLDNYVWAEGYIIRGPNAGTLSSARIPYLTGRTANTVQKVFDGPYPE